MRLSAVAGPVHCSLGILETGPFPGQGLFWYRRLQSIIVYASMWSLCALGWRLVPSLSSSVACPALSRTFPLHTELGQVSHPRHDCFGSWARLVPFLFQVMNAAPVRGRPPLSFKVQLPSPSMPGGAGLLCALMQRPAGGTNW